jgi:hypothetical protein
MAGRGLTPLEEAEARIVFADSILYHRVRVVENAGWTNALPRMRGWFANHPLPAADNAVALGHTTYFPRGLQSSPGALAEGRLGDFSWLIHELAHVWQAERIGPRYALQALGLHLSIGRDIYSYGGETAVLAATEAGRTVADFNVEQQAEIARDYYVRRRMGIDTLGWEPLIAGFRAR